MDLDEFKAIVESEMIRSSVAFDRDSEGNLKVKFRLVKGHMVNGNNGTLCRSGIAASFTDEVIEAMDEATLRKNVELMNQAQIRQITLSHFWGPNYWNREEDE